MTFDLSWLWDLLDSIVSTMQSWFASLWTQAQNITNTGQGLFSGLVAFGSQIWDAFIKGMDTLGKWLGDAFNWIYEGLKYWADVFGQWFSNAMAWIGSGITWIAQQLYNFGYWFYNSLLFVWNWLVNTIIGLWEGMVAWFSGVASAIGSWWGSVTTGINTWWTNLLKGFRQKIVTTIMADITIAGAWKGAERVMNPSKMSDVGYGLLGIIASPIVGRVVGEIVNAVVPLPSSATYPLIPEISTFSYTPPSISIIKPTEPTKPPLGVPPTPPYWFIPYLEAEKEIELSYDYSWTFQKSADLTIDLSYETEVT